MSKQWTFLHHSFLNIFWMMFFDDIGGKITRVSIRDFFQNRLYICSINAISKHYMIMLSMPLLIED